MPYPTLPCKPFARRCICWPPVGAAHDKLGSARACLDQDRPHRFHFNGILDLVIGRLRDNDLVCLGVLLQPTGQVHRIADDRVIQEVF